MQNKPIIWTDEEVKLLKEKYPISSKDELILLFPNRSYKSISGKADKLKLTKLDRDFPWTNEEDELLKSNYENCDEKTLLKLLPNRSWIGIQSRASKLKIRKYRKFTDQYTNWTDETIYELVNSRGYVLLEVFLNKNNRKTLKVKCPQGHVTDIILNDFRRGQECVKCTGKIKIDYKEVKEFIESQNYVLLSKENEYKNTSTKITVKCPNNHIYKVAFSEFKSGKRCQQCYFEKMGEKFLLDFDVVKKVYKEHGFIIENNQEYKGVNHSLKCRCIEHKDRESLELSYYQIMTNKNNCPYCIQEKQHKQYQKEYKKLLQKFYSLKLEVKTTEENFITMRQLKINDYIEFICLKHKYYGVQSVKWKSINRKDSKCFCAICCKEPISGENHPNWQGGISNINEYLRHKIQPWKNDSFKAYNYMCDITGIKRDLVIHHKYSFSKIVKETLEELDIDLKQTVSEYTNEELMLIENKCLELHYNYGLGICLTIPIHDLFHQTFSFFDFTPEDYDKFKENFINGKYKELENSSFLIG